MMLERNGEMEPVTSAERAALVIGGGLAGMQASLLLAAAGVHVYLVDRAPAIGGHQPLLDRTFPTNSCGLCFMSPRPAAYCPFVECERNELVSVMASTEVVGLAGEAGDFSARLGERARGVAGGKCTGCGRCAEVCPVSVPSELGGGVESRKAIYRPFPQAVPDSYLVDWESCTRCGECTKACTPGAIDLEQQDTERTLQVGAIVLATGFKPIDASLDTEYGHGVYPNVVTGIQLERMLSHSGPFGGAVRRPSDREVPRRVAFIQCVGSRHPASGRGYCSSVCCMYAARQASLLKRRVPDASVVVFQMDLRALGKGYDRYVRQVQVGDGVEYRRSAVASVKQLPGRKDLLVSFVDGDGARREESFSMVVLSVGVEPSEGTAKLAERLGVGRNRYGFVESSGLLSEETSVPGIFVAGGGREPMDVADAVAEGAAAAAAVARLLGVRLGGDGSHPNPLPKGDGRGGLSLPKGDGTDGPPLPAGDDGTGRLPLPLGEGRGEGGHPGPLASEAPRVGVLLCNCGGEIGDRIDLEALSARVSAWPEVAQVAIVDGLCRSTQSSVLGPQSSSVNRLVVAACARRKVEDRLATESARAGLSPQLLELVNLREQCGWVHPNGGSDLEAKAATIVAMGVAKAAWAEAIPNRSTGLPAAALVVGGGAAGLVAAATLADHGVEVWLVERESEWGGDLRRSADGPTDASGVDLLHGLVGRVQGSDRVHLLLETEVVRVDGHLGTFHATVRVGDQTRQLDHAVLMLATGVEEVQPGGYLLGEHPAVITQSQLERRLDEDETWALQRASVAMMLCAGSLENGGGYCSRTCCSQAVTNALRLKELNPSAQVYVLHREMRTNGFLEDQYEAARRAGVVFLRHDLERKPELVPNGKGLRVQVWESRLGRTVWLEVDTLALAVGARPRRNESLVGSLGVGVDEHGFFVEANVKTRSTESRRPGVFLCGNCQSPRSLPATLVHAKAAAMRALTLLRPGEVAVPATAPTVNERICSGCGICVASCAYGARVLDTERNVSTVVDVLCQGCGSCAASCPNGATQQSGFSGRQMVAVLDAALGVED